MDRDVVDQDSRSMMIMMMLLFDGLTVSEYDSTRSLLGLQCPNEETFQKRLDLHQQAELCSYTGGSGNIVVLPT